MTRDGQQSDLTEPRPQSTPVDAQARGRRTAWICAAHLVTAETALAAPNGGYTRVQSVLRRGLPTISQVRHGLAVKALPLTAQMGAATGVPGATTGPRGLCADGRE